MTKPTECPDSEKERKAKRAIFLLYLFMAVGVSLPVILFLIFGLDP